MKKTDIAMIILIATVSVMVAFFVTKSLLGDQVNEPVKVKTVDKIESTITKPDPVIFNGGAINPTVEVQIKSATE